MTTATARFREPRRRLRKGGRERHRQFKRYCLGLAAVLVLLALTALGLNSLVDPLWLGAGNRFTGQNYIFNERLAKLNLLLQDPQRYDCLIFGSSRVTLMDQTQIAGQRCFNLAFSAGKVADFVAYARYLADRGIRPELVIVGVDDFNFLRLAEEPLEVPDFVRDGEPPPGLLHSYLSLSALDFTQRTLRGDSPLARYYDDRFIGRVLPGTPPYEPPAKLRDIEIKQPYDPARVALYRAIRTAFPEARFWGFVPPVSPWKVAEWRYLGGVLKGYFEAMERAAAVFDVFYDFSAPSATTRNRENTYDGSHYLPKVYSVVARRLQAAERRPPADGFGLPVHAMSRAHYRRAFTARLDRFLAQKFPQLARPRRAGR
jgi:hypothetical protein